jgi:hypothetical protein
MSLRQPYAVFIGLILTTMAPVFASVNPQSANEPSALDVSPAPGIVLPSGLHVVLRDFAVTNSSGGQIFFSAGERVALKSSNDITAISYVAEPGEGSDGILDEIQVSSASLPSDVLSFVQPGDQNTLISQTPRLRVQETRVRGRGRGDDNQYRAYYGGEEPQGSPLENLFGSGGSYSQYGQPQASQQPKYKTGVSSGGRMLLYNAQGDYQGTGCVAFVKARVGWPGGSVHNGVGMVSALIRTMHWRAADCSPVGGKVASWREKRGRGPGHTAMYNEQRQCWEFDHGRCTPSQISGLVMIGCAVSPHMAASY